MHLWTSVYHCTMGNPGADALNCNYWYFWCIYSVYPNTSILWQNTSNYTNKMHTYFLRLYSRIFYTFNLISYWCRFGLTQQISELYFANDDLYMQETILETTLKILSTKESNVWQHTNQGIRSYHNVIQSKI